MTKLEMTFLNKSVGEKVGSGCVEQAAAGAASCTGAASPLPLGGQEGWGGEVSRCRLQFPHISKSQPCASRSRLQLKCQSKVCARLTAQQSPEGCDCLLEPWMLAEVRDDAEVQGAYLHALRFFGSVGNTSLDSLPLSHNRAQGENLEAAGWNL